MKVKIIITANIKKPKVGNAFGGYGLAGRAGYWEEPIKRVKKNYIIVAGKMISIKEYAYRNAMNNSRKKVKIIVGDYK